MRSRCRRLQMFISAPNLSLAPLISIPQFPVPKLWLVRTVGVIFHGPPARPPTNADADILFRATDVVARRPHLHPFPE